MAKKPVKKPTEKPPSSTVDRQLAQQDQNTAAAKLAGGVLASEIAIRAVGSVMRRSFEKRVISRNYNDHTAKHVVENRSMVHAITAFAATKLATRSVPGALLVGGGLLAKTLFDRGTSKRKSRKAAKKPVASKSED